MEIEVIFGLIGLTFFVYKNPHKRFLYWISLFVLGLLISQLIYSYLNEIVGQVIWVLSAIGLILFYSLRLKDKDALYIIDYLKILAIVLLLVYPLPFYSFWDLPGDVFWTVLRSSTFCIVGGIFVYDRWILKPEPMKKKFIVALVAQSLLILLMLMYAFVQQAEAESQRRFAEQQQRIAEENARKCYELQKELENAR